MIRDKGVVIGGVNSFSFWIRREEMFIVSKVDMVFMRVLLSFLLFWEIYT